MAWYLFGTKPLPGPMMSYCNWAHGNTLSGNRIKTNNFSLTKSILICRLQNVGHFVNASNRHNFQCWNGMSSSNSNNNVLRLAFRNLMATPSKVSTSTRSRSSSGNWWDGRHTHLCVSNNESVTNVVGHPGGHYWNSCPDALSLRFCKLFLDRTSVKCSIFNRIQWFCCNRYHKPSIKCFLERQYFSRVQMSLLQIISCANPTPKPNAYTLTCSQFHHSRQMQANYANLKRMFLAFDTHKEGFVDLEDLQSILNQFTVPLSDQLFSQLMQRYVFNLHSSDILVLCLLITTNETSITVLKWKHEFEIWYSLCLIKKMTLYKN